MRWDIFCKVIDNHGDLGVCWRLSRQLAARGHAVRLWVDDARALAWMEPGALQGVFTNIAVLPWTQPLAPLPETQADVWIEAFGCDIPPEFIAHRVRRVAVQNARPPVWINLEYLSAERHVERLHTLPSPVLHGPAAGWTKWFFYPGFTPATGGLLREDDLPARLAAFDRAAWRRVHGVPGGALAASLFCYEPPALLELFAHWRQSAQPVHLFVTAGRAADAARQAVDTLGAQGAGALTLDWLPYLPQAAYDELLWGCDLNFVRGEDSLVRALLAGQPFVWQIYPQHDGAHHAKLQAFLDWLDAPPSLRDFHRVWNGITPPPLPAPDWDAWRECVSAARARLLAHEDLASQLIRFVSGKQLK
ncbi:MAG: elongation factor P maturation arginine rhamnosyltransferase EarP [Burkholderiaceae bacterium]|jgi:uncharacterized repeat protein (TIGR03837 family)|nr:elongation factor P maturation arginine rhamnosyltransferase EarP [Burkholderiaceae bacterium]